jgi:hypothetical protein
MKRLFAIPAFAYFFLWSNMASGQSGLSDTLRNKFESFQQKNLQEKIYVHLDHTSYVTGETLWVKIYCVDSRAHILLDASKVVYVEVIDRHGQSVLKTKIKLMNGEGDGSFFLPATLDSDNYTLRAYTNWIKNRP